MAEFLRATLEPFASNFSWQGHGILEWAPAAAPQSGSAADEIFVISAGIHGNETAPIELLDQLVQAFSQSESGAAAPCLFLLGNIEAMRVQQRYVGTNLNRLFGPGSENRALISGDTAEAREHLRARTLQLAVRGFQARYPGRVMVHLDLHTAIRQSAISRFAILPPQNDALEAEAEEALLNDLLRAAGMLASVRHQESGSTFSGWTAREFGAVSATLELGQVKAFGDNDLSLIHQLEQTLKVCCSAEYRRGRTLAEAIAAEAGNSEMTSFMVHHEIVRETKDLELNLDDDVANFQLLPEGMTLYSDAGSTYKVDHAEARILFPNPKVEIGHRAGLVVVPADPSSRAAPAS